MVPLSNKQGYELARIGTKHGLSVDLQRLIWADVTKNYYLRGSVTERAATLLQAAWRRLYAIFGMQDSRRLNTVWQTGSGGPYYFARSSSGVAMRWDVADQRRFDFRRAHRDRINSLG